MIRFFQTNEITEAWSRATARRIDAPVPPPVKAYIDALAAEYQNGRVVYAELELDLDEPVFRMAADHESWKFSQLLDLLWLVPEVAKRLPGVGRTHPDLDGQFAPADVFQLAAFMASVLHQGGAYSSRTRPTTSRSLALGVGCAEALMEGQLERAFLATTCWCDFFLDVAWDYTAVVVLPDQKRVKVLMATDTD